MHSVSRVALGGHVRERDRDALIALLGEMDALAELALLVKSFFLDQHADDLRAVSDRFDRLNGHAVFLRDGLHFLGAHAQSERSAQRRVRFPALRAVRRPSFVGRQHAGGLCLRNDDGVPVPARTVDEDVGILKIRYRL